MPGYTPPQLMQTKLSAAWGPPSGPDLLTVQQVCSWTDAGHS